MVKQKQWILHMFFIFEFFFFFEHNGFSLINQPINHEAQQNTLYCWMTKWWWWWCMCVWCVKKKTRKCHCTWIQKKKLITLNEKVVGVKSTLRNTILWFFIIYTFTTTHPPIHTHKHTPTNTQKNQHKKKIKQSTIQQFRNHHLRQSAG